MGEVLEPYPPVYPAEKEESIKTNVFQNIFFCIFVCLYFVIL